MALKELPGGELYQDDGGSTWMDTRLNTFQVRRANVWQTV